MSLPRLPGGKRLWMVVGAVAVSLHLFHASLRAIQWTVLHAPADHVAGALVAIDSLAAGMGVLIVTKLWRYINGESKHPSRPGREA